MKKIILILLVVLFWSCDSPDANDCFQTAGKTVSKTMTVAVFDKILVNRNVQLTIKQDSIISVYIKTGKNLINDVDVRVVAGELQLTDGNICNMVRDYNATKITVTMPNLSSIRNSSQFEVVSEGTFRTEKLSLISEDFNDDENFNVGDFKLNLAVTDLQVVSNNISSFYLSGVAENLSIGFYAGAGRFEGKDLNAQHVTVFHRGSNDMLINPLLSLEGELNGTGNVLSKNKPEYVDVEQKYKGKLIFID